MINYAEYTDGPSVSVSLTTLAIVKISPEYMMPDLVVKDQNIVYQGQLADAGVVIVDEPSLNYTLLSYE